MLRVKRVYEAPAAEDGHRILVDRLWPRGMTKAELRAEAWRKDLAPSTALREWFHHEPSKWDEFLRRYRAELESSGRWKDLMALARQAEAGNVTLLYASRDTERNQAVALREMALGRRGPRSRQGKEG
jgi:uncharacterized protein YeaO (DUF488 family)